MSVFCEKLQGLSRLQSFQQNFIERIFFKSGAAFFFAQEPHGKYFPGIFFQSLGSALSTASIPFANCCFFTHHGNVSILLIQFVPKNKAQSIFFTVRQIFLLFFHLSKKLVLYKNLNFCFKCFDHPRLRNFLR